MLLRPRARADREHAYAWWIANHGPLVPSRLEAELLVAFQLLGANPEIGYAGFWHGRPIRKLRLACGFFVLYQVRSILRQVVILRILAGSRLHG
ncbi:MAG: type II toxin-antitoxin system RelE/ParE family toxin [Myxococcales bacterium]|nr:type II toxin-antitoxin system RelE/ParE family toxin [Myxococcales bacterium]